MKTIYTFICDNCNFQLESLQEIANYKSLKKCPECKKNKLYRDYAADSVNVSVRLGNDEIKVGHLADRNTQRLSNDEKNELTKKHNAYKDQDISDKLPEGMSQIKKKDKKVLEYWFQQLLVVMPG